MLERILFAPGANAAALLRSLALHGVNTIALRVVGSVELAQLALMRSGIADDRLFFTRSDEAGVIYQVTGQAAADKRDSLSFEQCQDIADALRSLRHLITENEEQNVAAGLAKGTFREKNGMLADVYDKYRNAMQNSKGILELSCDDDVVVEDTVMLVRRAAEQASPVDAEFLTLEEFPLSPLERTLLDKVSGGTFRTLSLPELYGKEPVSPAVESVTSAYGSTNEVEDIIGQIYEQKLPLDSCTVAVTDTKAYSQLFYDYALRCNIPVTFGCGVPIINSNPARLLMLYIEWATYGGRGIEALRSMIMSDACDHRKIAAYLEENVPGFGRLDDVIELTGSLRLGGEPEENEQRAERLREIYKAISDDEERAGRERLLDSAALLGHLLSGGPQSFCADFSLVRSGLPGRVDLAARPVISSGLTSVVCAGDILDSAGMLLRRSVCRENSCAGHLHITGIAGALSSLGENLFVAGLSADMFPGRPVENYLLLDDDYRCFTDDSCAPTSDRIAAARKKNLTDLVSLAGALGVPVRLSCPDYSLTGLNEENPSSVIYELDPGEKAEKRNAGYFAHVCSVSSLVGTEYLEGRRTEEQQVPDENPADITIGWRLSPTAIEKFVRCARMFYLNVVLGLKDREEDDQDEILPAAAQGTFIHELMEMFVGGQPDYSDYTAKAGKLFDDYLAGRVPLPGSEDRVKAAREEFLAIAEKAYYFPKNTVTAAEKQLEGTIGGLAVGGIADGIERLPDGGNIVVDYKTGHKVRQTDGDVKSCIQTMLYARLLEQSGTPVTRCEYRYPRSGTTVVCEVNDVTRKALDEIMQALNDALESGEFSSSADAETCKYCPVKGVCGEGRK